jgi:hypothetical protein
MKLIVAVAIPVSWRDIASVESEERALGVYTYTSADKELVGYELGPIEFCVEGGQGSGSEDH